MLNKSIFAATSGNFALLFALSALSAISPSLSYAADGISVSADVNARVGWLSRSGATAKDFANANESIDGNYGVFITGTKDLKGGYSASFYCHTVATTAPGAAAAFTAEALPVKNAWDGYFAGKENYPQNNHGGGFASYGESNGDNLGPFCNDEVYGTLATPYGSFKIGNIMNPMRLLYDMATVDPLWGNQVGYYNLADIRGNALNYSNTFNDLRVDVQWQTATNATVPGSVASKGRALTAVLTYDTGTGTTLGAGVITANGAFSSKVVVPSPSGQHNTAYGLMVRSLLGRANVGYTFMTGKQKPDVWPTATGGEAFKMTDHTFKLAYDINKWSLQGFLSFSKTRFNQPGAWGGGYTVQDGGALNGKTFNDLEIKRTGIDLWALYNLGNGTQPYLRLNTIQKKYSAQDLNYSGTIRGTKIEAGWMIHI